MLFILRKFRRALFSSSKLRSYLVYAAGEIFLVVIGILIALQINNWNAARQKEASLVSYLSSIARNISDDLGEVRSIRYKRESTLENSLRLRMRHSVLDAADIPFASYALDQAEELFFFNASQSGYQALVNSGMLDQMQGRDVENLLFDYYDCVRKISFLEANHNEILKLHWEQAKLVWPDTMESWEFGDPTALSPKRLAGLMPVIKNYLSSRSIFDLLEHAAQAAPLLLEYERLERLGTVYLKTVESGSLDLDAESLALLNGIHDPDGVTGYPEIIRNGQIAYGHFELLWADSLDWRIAGGVQDSADGRKLSTTFEINSIVRMDDSLYMRYPGGADWAAHSIIVRGSGDRRSSRDYSIYSKLVLELKGEKGGETILVNLKDRDDPDDGSQTNIELILTQQWQTYEIDLGEFDNADLAKLHLTLGFLFGNEPQAFFIRSAVYQ